MKPARFDYLRPDTVAEAVAALAAANTEAGTDGGAVDGGAVDGGAVDGGAVDGGAKVIAGGQSLVPLLSMRLSSPGLLVDLNAVPELAAIRPGPASVTVGAMTRHRELAACAHEPLLAAAAGWIGHTAIRTRGTIGGSLAHADPNAEWPAVALACDATISAAGPAGSRTIAADGFFHGLLQTDLGDDEILTSVELARPRRWGLAELARRHGDFALVLSVVTELDDGWRVVLGGVAGTPVRCSEAESLLDEGDRDPRRVGAAAAASAAGAYTDLHATARYRQAMAAELTAQALTNLTSGSHHG